jgi:hypothetical protein
MDSPNKPFDFSHPIEFSKFDAELDRKPQTKVEKTSKPERTPAEIKNQGMKQRQVLLVVFLLLISLIAAGAFSIMQTLRIQELEEELNPGPEVAGVTTSLDGDNIIVGSGFSIIVEQKTPEGFKLETDFGPIDYLNQPGSTTSLLAQVDKGGVELLTGIVVEVVEYDNKLENEEFVERIQEYLGSSYSLTSERIQVSDQFELAKFIPQSQDDPTYYVTVTTDNYYLITLYNQTAEYPEFTDHTRFTDSLVPGLWLN